jgi:glycosyltransferase involved in cell wall biosynthesis
MDELGIASDVVDLGVIPPAAVADICRLCHALSFPSVYEGFGRPTLEAQACRLPAVLADASCMREVGGDGALYHEPRNAVQLAELLAKVMTDPAIRETLGDAGERNIRNFTWEAHVRKLVSVYEEVAALSQPVAV